LRWRTTQRVPIRDFCDLLDTGFIRVSVLFCEAEFVSVQPQPNIQSLFHRFPFSKLGIFGNRRPSPYRRSKFGGIVWRGGADGGRGDDREIGPKNLAGWSVWGAGYLQSRPRMLRGGLRRPPGRVKDGPRSRMRANANWRRDRRKRATRCPKQRHVQHADAGSTRPTGRCGLVTKESDLRAGCAVLSDLTL
jgi:hypothetical protein